MIDYVSSWLSFELDNLTFEIMCWKGDIDNSFPV